MNLSEALFGPSPALTSEPERQQARLLAGFCLVEAIVMLCSATQAWHLASPAIRGPLVPLLVASAIVCLGLYVLARTAHLRAALHANLAVNWFLPVAVLMLRIEGMRVFDTAAWFVTSIAISGILTGQRTTLLVGAASALVPLLGLKLFPDYYGSGPALYQAAHAVVFLGHVTILMCLLTQLRKRVESFRRAELVARNEELFALNEELLALKSSLEERVEQRTEDLRASHADLGLAYQELRKNQESMIVQEKMASLGRLTAGIAHEMSSPVAAARASLSEAQGLVDEYERSIGDAGVTEADHREIAAELRRAIDLGVKATERAAAFVRSIKSQTREMAAEERRPFDAVSAIRDALYMLGHEATASGNRVRFEPGAGRIDVVGSPSRLAQVVTNLVTNAFDANSERGGGDVCIHLEQKDHEVVLSVADSGPGIQPEVMGHIFEPLFTTKPVGKGTGLGLTIVNDIVAGHFHGHIDVQSEPGHGAEFVVRLPQAA